MQHRKMHSHVLAIFWVEMLSKILLLKHQPVCVCVSVCLLDGKRADVWSCSIYSIPNPVHTAFMPTRIEKMKFELYHIHNTWIMFSNLKFKLLIC